MSEQQLQVAIVKLELLRQISAIKKMEKTSEQLSRLMAVKETTLKDLRPISLLTEFMSSEEHYAETLEMIVNNLDSIPDLPAIKEAIDNAEGRYKFVMELFGDLLMNIN